MTHEPLVNRVEPLSCSADRRIFLRTSLAAACTFVPSATRRLASAVESPPDAWHRVIGITTGSLNYQRENNILTALTLPRFVRDELGMRLIDLNTRWLKSFDESYVELVRKTTEDAGCFVSNLKVNHQFGNLYSSDADERKQALANARQLVRVAKQLGSRWIRFPVPRFREGDPARKLDAHRELARDASSRGIQLLVENNGWMRSDADSLSRLVEAIGNNAAPGPDTGNWDDEVRYAALEKSFPKAVTCDFKVFELNHNRQHTRYDIRRCFDIAWKAGFRGPWAIEHWNEDTDVFARDTVFLRDQLARWMAASG